MAIIEVKKQRAVSVSGSALAKTESIGHVVRVLEVPPSWNHKWAQNLTAGYILPSKAFYCRTNCGLKIWATTEPTYICPAYIGKKWVPKLQQVRDCLHCNPQREPDPVWLAEYRAAPDLVYQLQPPLIPRIFAVVPYEDPETPPLFGNLFSV